MVIDANGMHYAALNAAVRQCGEEAEIFGCVGQRYLGAGLAETGRSRARHPRQRPGGVPQRRGASAWTGNVQEATGDTMNGGVIEVHGSAGDATGYAMRGGKIFIEGDAGYRCGIHMKAYPQPAPRHRHRRQGGELFGRIPGGRHPHRVWAGNLRTASLSSGTSAARGCTAARSCSAATRSTRRCPRR